MIMDKQRDIMESLEAYINAYKTNNYEGMDSAITQYINLVSTYEEVNMNLIKRPTKPSNLFYLQNSGKENKSWHPYLYLGKKEI